MTAETAQQIAPDAFPDGKTPCAYCHAPFDKERSWQRFCSRKCRRDFHRAGNAVVVLERRVAQLEDGLKTLLAANRRLQDSIASLADIIKGGAS